MTLFGKIVRVTQILQSLRYYLVEYCRVAYHSKALFMLYQKIITASLFEQQDGIYGPFAAKKMPIFALFRNLVNSISARRSGAMRLILQYKMALSVVMCRLGYRVLYVY